ncbi:MAG: hypothetical protein LUH15_12630 [Tannerellaceae bacterium]|nr:hypothetical protein [Tannerellaceae bacterium]
MKPTIIHIKTALLFIIITCPGFLYSRCPAINKTENDTIFFVRRLYNSFDIDTPFVFTPGNSIKIDTITLYGSHDPFILVEYDYPEGPMADYPWKIQFLITTDYKPVTYFQAEQYELINVFPDQNPLLLILNATGKGNGWHEIYRIKDNTCINICEPDEPVQTYDAHKDHDLFDHPELQLTIEDRDNDGFNDLIFKGARQYYDPPAQTTVLKSEPVEYLFLYNPEKEIFEVTK